MRSLPVAIALSLVSSSVMAQAVTTRIETRPYYGAVVTIEKGVRVWRALPPHDRIIINPDGKARVNLSIGSSSVAAPPTVFNNSTTVVTPPRRLLRYAD